MKSVEINIVEELENAHKNWLISKDYMLEDLKDDLARLDILMDVIKSVRTDVEKAIKFIDRGEE